MSEIMKIIGDREKQKTGKKEQMNDASCRESVIVK